MCLLPCLHVILNFLKLMLVNIPRIIHIQKKKKIKQLENIIRAYNFKIYRMTKSFIVTLIYSIYIENIYIHYSADHPTSIIK